MFRIHPYKRLSLLFFLLVLTFTGAISQNITSSMQAFDNLVGGTWKGEGQWQDGTPFKQHIEFEWGLSGKIIKSKTYANVGEKSNEFELRNEGIRLWSDEASAIIFWEFDIFGGITEGTIDIDAQNIYYHYSYDTGQGSIELTDAWIYKEKDTYEFVVGEYQDGEWKQKYLTTVLKKNH